MGKQLVKKGRAFHETATAIISAENNFSVSNDMPIVIVEGTDDITVLSKYYFYKASEKPAKFVTAKDFRSSSAGKKKAIEYYYKCKDMDHQVYCLLDKDYDFYLKNNKEDENIFYYHFFELENYLFDDSVFRVFLATYFNVTEETKLEELLGKLEPIKEVLRPLADISLFRELHFYDKSSIQLTEEQQKKLVALGRLNNMDWLLSDKNKDLNTVEFNKKIKHFIDMELREVNLTLEEIKIDTNIYLEKHKEIEFLKLALSGKVAAKAIVTILEYCFGFSRTKKNVENIITACTDEWIPLNSRSFRRLIGRIEKKIEEDKSVS